VYDLALENILENGGTVVDNNTSIETQEYEFDGEPKVSFNNLSFKNIFTTHVQSSHRSCNAIENGRLMKNTRNF